MVAAVVGQRDWLTTALTTRERIESTNARVQEEWQNIRAADPHILGGNQHIDASDWEVGKKAVGTKDRRVASILWRLDAIVWRLNIINNWLDAIIGRLSDDKSDGKGNVRDVLLGIKPSVEEIGVIFQEIKGYIFQVRDLIKEIRNSWRRYAVIFLLGLIATVGAAAIGVAIGSQITNWVSG